jgi:hypothetical protein
MSLKGCHQGLPTFPQNALIIWIKLGFIDLPIQFDEQY